MKTVKIDLPENVENLHIHTFADWHIGDAHCNMREINEMIDKVKNEPNSYCILNGDLMNNATKSSVSDSYSELIPPMSQVNRLTEMLTPIKDKILMVTQGNHEARTFKQDGIDLSMILANNLGCVDKYCANGGVLFIRFGKGAKSNGSNNSKQYYSIYVLHGSGGGRKEGGKINRLCEMNGIVDCDCYIHSHTHLPVITKEKFYRVSLQNSSIKCIEKLFVNTSSKLEYGGYGQAYEFKPSALSNPVIHLSGTRKEMKATL